MTINEQLAAAALNLRDNVASQGDVYRWCENMLWAIHNHYMANESKSIDSDHDDARRFFTEKMRFFIQSFTGQTSLPPKVNITMNYVQLYNTKQTHEDRRKLRTALGDFFKFI